VALLRLKAQRRYRTGIKTCQRNWFAGLVAIAIRIFLNPAQRRFDLGNQLALTVPGTKLQRSVCFGRGAVSKVGKRADIFLQGKERGLALSQYLVFPWKSASSLPCPAGRRECAARTVKLILGGVQVFASPARPAAAVILHRFRRPCRPRTHRAAPSGALQSARQPPRHLVWHRIPR